MIIRYLNVGFEFGAVLVLLWAAYRAPRFMDTQAVRPMRAVLVAFSWMVTLVALSTVVSISLGRSPTIATWAYAPTMVGIIVSILGMVVHHARK